MAKQTAREIHIKQWNKETANLKNRIRKWEKKYGYKVDIEELKESLGVSFDVPEQITKNKLRKIKNIGYKQYRKFAYDPNIPDEIYNDQPSEDDEDIFDIADMVIERLVDFINSYENPEIREYVLEGRKSDLLDYLYRGINTHGKEAVAANAERSAEQMDFAMQYMDESKAERSAILLGKFGEAVFGRSFSLAELIGLERHAEYNGHYA